MRTQARTAKALATTLLRATEPGYLILYVNNVCNLRCHMCLAWDQMQKPTHDLSLAEHQELSKSFRSLLQLTLTGGEPLLRRDLVEVVEAYYYYANSGVAKCTLVTNATYPDRLDDFVDRIWASCPDIDLTIAVSIDGPPEVHESVRGVEGCHEKTVTSLERLLVQRAEHRALGRKMTVSVTTVISKRNWRFTVDTYDYIRENFDVDNHSFLLARGETKDADAKDVPVEAYEVMEAMLDREESRSSHYLDLPIRALSRTMRDIVARTAKTDEYVLPCVAGGRFIEVYSDGEVIPCEIIGARRDPSLGNVRDFGLDIRELLRAEAARDMRSFISDTNCRCTFECTIYASLAFNPAQYPRVLSRLLR